MPDDFQSIHAEVTRTLGKDPNAAFQVLRKFLAYPAKLDESDWAPAFSLFASVAEKFAGRAWTTHLTNAAATPRNAKSLYDLGYQLIEQQLPDLAATVLARADSLAPGIPALISELCVALEDLGLHKDAVELLQRNSNLLATNPMLQYMLGFHSLMLGNVADARTWIDQAGSSPDLRMRDVVTQGKQMLARADCLRGSTTLDETDLRGWQFVTSGTILLHLSPYGFAEGMRGRYAFLQDSDANCKEGILRLKLLLEAWSAAPECVWILPDRDSKILGLAAAQLLNRPARPIPPGGPQTPGLIVVYDVAACDLETLKAIVEHRPGQILWSQAANWTREGPFAADITTLLFQMNVSPWGAGRMTANPQTQEMESAPAIEGSPETLAARLVDAVSEEIKDAEALTKLAVAAARLTDSAAGGAFRISGRRRRQPIPSPVKSNRFH